MHPPSPINTGEAWTKSVYEAVRGSPQWNNTLFLIIFDEHGVRLRLVLIREIDNNCMKLVIRALPTMFLPRLECLIPMG